MFTFAAQVGRDRWYGFTSREDAAAWVSRQGGNGQIVPAILAPGKLVAPADMIPRA